MTNTQTTASDVVTTAMSIADDAAQGRLDPAALEAQTAAELRQLFGTVVGPDDVAWPIQLDVARQVLALGGVPADELAEWLAIERQRAGEPVSAPDPDETSPELEATGSSTVSADSEHVAPELADVEPVEGRAAARHARAADTTAPRRQVRPASQLVARSQPAPTASEFRSPGVTQAKRYVTRCISARKPMWECHITVSQ